MGLAQRLLSAGQGGGFAPPIGPYLPSAPHAVTILTQFHCHTTNSDGIDTPAQIVAGYLARGYGALMLSDHDVVSAQPAGITTAIQGNEVSPTTAHVISINSAYLRGAVTDVQTILDGIEADGGRAEIAHPNWSIGMTVAEMDALDPNWLGMEIYNSSVMIGGGVAPPTSSGAAVESWDDLLTNTRRTIWGFAVDDLHWPDVEGEIHDLGRCQIFAASNTLANILDAIETGRFVADVCNYGVTPGYPVRTGTDVTLTCAGATSMEAYGTGGTLLDTEAGDTISYTFMGSELYVRLVAIGDYTEPFSTALDDRWGVIDGTWAVTAGVLRLTTPGGGKKIVQRRQTQSAFQAQVDMKLGGSTVNDAAALMTNCRLDTDYTYYIRIGDDELTLTRIEGAGQTLLGTAVFVAAAGTFYTVKVDYAAGDYKVKAWETGTSEPGWMIEETDATWEGGAFGLAGAGSTVDFDNLYINGFRTFYQPIPVG